MRTFNDYLLEKNFQGDIVAIYNQSELKISVYNYDDWGKTTVSVVGDASATEILVANTYNLLRYRAYSLRDENDIIVGGAQANTKSPAIMVVLIDICSDNIFLWALSQMLSC